MSVEYFMNICCVYSEFVFISDLIKVMGATKHPWQKVRGWL